MRRDETIRVAGLMSGTSADGIDAAITDIDAGKIKLVAFDTFAYPKQTKKEILKISEQRSCTAEDISKLNFIIGRLFADAVIKLCRKNKINLETINIIGSHGQTIYHNPCKKDGSTLQIGEPAVIAYKTGITTIADFRTKDVAAGGQGAPLVPFADWQIFRDKRKNRAIQNIGGIANVTFLPAGCKINDVTAFDTGPGNMIIDRIVSIYSKGKLSYDRAGKIAAKGKVNDRLLKEAMGHPFFKKSPPKSTGREEFGERYTKEFIKKAKKLTMTFEDTIATATALTAFSIADAYKKFLPKMPEEVILCGGGARNNTIIHMLKFYLKNTAIRTSNEFGIDSDAKEAVSFAVLAWATINGIKNNIPTTTGAKEPLILGKIVLPK